jgi:hypothetical protein
MGHRPSATDVKAVTAALESHHNRKEMGAKKMKAGTATHYALCQNRNKSYTRCCSLSRRKACGHILADKTAAREGGEA